MGAPTELLTAPTSTFVADFVGASRAARPVRVSGPGGLVVDEAGTPVGTLTQGGHEALTPSGASPAPVRGGRP